MEFDINYIIQAVITVLSIVIGLFLGSRMTSKSIIKELDAWMNRSEFFQMLKKIATEQQLVEKATVFFEEATALVSSPEAKQFFKNATAALKEFSSDTPEVKVELPEKVKKEVKE